MSSPPEMKMSSSLSNSSRTPPSTDHVEDKRSPLNNTDILKHIFWFVGECQYRFIAGVSHRFKEAYLDNFPYPETYLNASTEEHARICYTELKDRSYANGIELCRSAVSHCSIPALDFLRTIKCTIADFGVCAHAAKLGNLELLQWCRQNGYEWDYRTCKKAAKYGHLELLQWCRKNGCPWNSLVCASAAKTGQLEVLKWCRKHGCVWDEHTIASAAGNGHLKVVQWCRRKGCPWDEEACGNAAQFGHLHVLQWLIENGCDYYDNLGDLAIEYGHSHIDDWLEENGII